MKSRLSSGKQKKPSFRPFVIRRVVGDSMSPSLVPGKVVVGVRYKTPRVGDVVICAHDGREIIKRVKIIQRDGLHVEGDNLGHSRDSRHYGLVPRSSVLAVAVWPWASVRRQKDS